MNKWENEATLRGIQNVERAVHGNFKYDIRLNIIKKEKYEKNGLVFT